MATNTSIFHNVNEAIIDDIAKELDLQGHRLTGALEASLKAKEIAENGGVVLTAQAAAYLENLEKGIQPEDIVINSQKLAEMANYVRLRMGYQGSKAMQVAYNILRKQAAEGNPTKNSYRFSKTGKRKEVVKETFAKNEVRYGNMLDVVVVGQLDNQFNQIKSGTI